MAPRRSHYLTMPASLRVLHVFKTYYPDTFGGIEQVIRQLTSVTSSMGVANQIYTLSPKARLTPVLFDGATKIIRSPVDLELASTPMSLRALGSFRAAARWADLIHYHYPWPFGDLLHLLGAQGKPAILTYHSDVVRQRLLMPFYRPLLRYFFKQMRAIVPESPNYLESSELLQDYRDKTTVIPIGLNEAYYHPPEPERLAHWRSEVGTDFFLFVGVLRYYKGLHILLDACVGSSAKVVIVGAGPVENDLKAQAQRLGLTNVVFLGAVSDEDKIALLELCRAVVFPSHLRSEAFGVTLLEGAMHGRPLISSEIGTGSSYVNVDGVTGIVVPPSDPAALRVAMHTLSTNHELASQMGLRARIRFETLFTARQMGEAYVALYERIVGRSA